MIAIYPGTFDPLTFGHLDIIQRSAKLFDHIIVGVAQSSQKSPFFDIDQRLESIVKATNNISNVQVLLLQGLLVNFAQEHQATIIIRGVRTAMDLDYELQLASMNAALAPKIETIFLPAAEKYRNISGTFVREIMEVGGDVGLFVPK